MVGESQTLTPTLTLKGETIIKGVTYKYISDDTNVTTVDNATANVKGIEVGSTNITIEAMTADGKMVATTTIKVAVTPLVATQITIESSRETIKSNTWSSPSPAYITTTVTPDGVGDTITITASPEIYFKDNGDGTAEIWVNNQPVLKSDVIITITATCGAVSDSTNITALAADPVISSVTISTEGDVNEMIQDPLIPQTLTFYASVEPSGLDLPITFHYDPFGTDQTTFIDHKDGTATVTVKAGTSIIEKSSFEVWARCGNKQSRKIMVTILPGKTNYF